MKRVLIIGNGVAGIATAKELRARCAISDLEITVLARESYDYYSRIRLPEAFGWISPEILAMYKPSWYEERGIAVSIAKEAVSIDRAARKVMLASGDELPYDELVLALGSDALRPSLRGSGLPGVFTVREYDDASRVRASIEAHPEAAAVVGGGLLGLEAARHMQLEGVARVSVLELAFRLLPRQLDSGGAALLERQLASLGIETITGARLSSFDGKDRLEGLSYERDGAPHRLAAGTAVVSMGVKPRIGLAKAAGLATNRGVIVDAFLRSSDPYIYAVGDCAEFGGVVLGIIPAALEEAPSCAAAILGDESQPYKGTIPSNTLKVAGLDVFSAGAVEADGAEELRYEPGQGRYERYLLKDGLLAGAIVMGSKARSRLIQPKLGRAMTRAELEALMTE